MFESKMKKGNFYLDLRENQGMSLKFWEKLLRMLTLQSEEKTIYIINYITITYTYITCCCWHIKLLLLYLNYKFSLL